MDVSSATEITIWLLILIQLNPSKLIEWLQGFYWWYNGIAEEERNRHPNTVPILHIVYLTDVIQSMLFPTMVDMCHFVMFNDKVFLSWITAVHHLGAALGGLLAWIVSYWQLESYLYKVPKVASITLTLHMIYFLRILEKNSMWHHIMWHGVYYVVYSFSQLAVYNLMVTSVGKRQTGTYMTISSAVAKLGNIIGPGMLIMVSMLSPTSIEKFKSSFRMRNADIAYILVLLLCVIRVVNTFKLEDPYVPMSKPSLEDTKDAILPATNENNANMALNSSLDSVVPMVSEEEMENKRYRILPYVILAVNVLSLIGAGLSIRFMFMYIVLKFQISYRLMWFANMCVPIASAAGLFIIDKQARKHGKLVAILASKSIALVLLYAFTRVENPTIVLIVYVMRFAFQNTPLALKTTIMLKYSSERANGYWLASDHMARIIIFGSTIMGGHLSKRSGLEYCFKATMVFYGAAQLLLLPCAFLFPDV